MAITMKVRSVRLDSRRVRTKSHDGAVRALFRASAFLRTVARRSIRSRGGNPSPAGQPPKSPTRYLRNSIRFEVERDRGVARIGPAFLRAPLSSNRANPIPAVLEFGGRVRTPVRRLKSGGRTRPKRIKVAPRPYMGPALAKAWDTGALPAAWRNSVRGP